MAYASITVEGGLFPADLLDKIASGDAPGQRPADFSLEGARLADEMQSAFSDARAFWDAFQRRLQTSRESTTTLTRESWIGPLLDRLGFRFELQRSSAEIGGQLYMISHRAGDDADAPPVHVVSIEQELDRRDGTARRSPHAVVQEVLNRSDALWGMATNGKRLRLLRDSVRLSKPTFLEFDLESMVSQNLYSEFVLLYRLIHASRFPRNGSDGQDCWLEKYHAQGIEQGGRVRDKLRDGVEESLRVLGSAFLRHPESAALRDRLASGQLDAPGYYRQLLRLVYRFLFLMVAEERRLVFPPDAAPVSKQNLYTKYYSVSRLRDRSDRYFAGESHGDLWMGLRQTFRLFRDDGNAYMLGLGALNGELFGQAACTDLETAVCNNEELLKAVRWLSTFVDEAKQLRRVNYASLDVEEFGSVYESLLDFHPQIDTEAWTFDLVTGSERKQTGSYYTPPELVHELIQSALAPVITERLAGAKTETDKERELLLLRVCDPAAGSGHFLLAAARKIARELAKVRSGEDEPPPEEYRHALRDVIRNCVYAVDKNPLAVDLCKVALWIEGHNAGMPLSFLDAHVRHGDSLVGVFDLKVLAEGVPDDAYKAVTGDEKPTATAVRKRNKQEREGQTAFSAGGAGKHERDDLATEFSKLAAIDERTPDDVHAKEDRYERLRSRGGEWWKTKVACDLWTYAFFAPITNEWWQVEGCIPTTNVVRKQLGMLSDDVREDAKAQAVQFAQAHPFFHWPLEFPDVFAKGGFDVVLGNPPWERIKLQEEEFFAVRNPAIAGAKNKAVRQRMIAALESGDSLAREFAAATHGAEAQSKFVRTSGRFPLCGVGDVNTYALFAEQFRRQLNPRGRAGVIVPTGIATDDTYKTFFAALVESGALVSLVGFENEAFIFPGVHHFTKFCLVTMRAPSTSDAAARIVFFVRELDQLRDEGRWFQLSSDDFRLLNPNSRTCPTFRSRRDAEINRRIYERVPVLANEATGESPWNVRFGTLFHMANDSHLFEDRDGPQLVPLYEGKMVHQFDHRFGTYAGQTQEQTNQGKLPELSEAQHADPNHFVIPRYWVPRASVEARLLGKWERRWMLGWRDITNATNERTVIASIIPRVG